MTKQLHIYIFLIGFAFSGHSQNHTYRQYTTDDGLPTNYVYGVIEDNEGYIWAYTENGLAKFDGQQFHHFSTEDGLPSNDVYHLVKDDTTGLLWMQTTAKVPAYVENDSIVALNDFTPRLKWLTKYNGKIRYTYHRFVKNRSIIVDSLLITEKFYQLIPKKARKKELIPSYRKEEIIYGSVNQSTRFEFNYKKNIYKEYSLPQILDITYVNYSHVGVYEMEQPFLIFSTRTLLYFFKLDTRTLISYNLENLNGSPVKHISIDFLDNQTLLLNTDKCYLFFDKNLDLERTFYPKNIAEQYTMLHLFIDSQGNYWMGTREGGLFFISKEELKTSYLQPNNVRDKVIEKLLWNKGTIYAVSDNSNIYQIAANDNLLPIYQHLKQPNFNDAIVRSNGDMIFTNAKEAIIFTNHQSEPIIGLPNYSPLKKLLKTKKNNPHFHINLKRVVWNEKHQQLFFSTLYGLFGYDIEQTTLQRIGPARHDWNIHTDTFNHRTYFAHQEGIYSFQNGQLQQELASQGTVTTLWAKDAQYLWIGTQNRGLLEWDRQTNEVRQITKRKYITAIWQDEHRYLLGTHEGVVVLQEKEDGYQETYCYDRKDGLLTAEILDVLADSQFIYAATIKGVMKIKKDHTPLVKDSLQRLSIQNVAVNDSTTALTKLSNLRHSQNEIVIQYHLLDFASKDNIQYHYRLAPIQQNWVTTDAKQVRFDDLRPQDYTFYLKATDWYGNEYTLKESLTFCIQKAWWQTWWFRLLVLALFLGTLAFFIKRREQQQQKKLAYEKSLNQQIADLQLQSLRGQMNPHFIFNALGSIQYFIQTHRTDEADNYLTMFARLMRKYLDSATERYVDVATELAMLKEYTELEMMRFEGLFQTFIQVDEDIDPEEESIPSMMLQPFVENAINHGLQLRTLGDGLLTIACNKNQKGALVFKISDNGIGRSNAAKYRKKSHVSRGMKNVHQRIETLRANGLSDIDILIDDLYPDDATYPGTIVTLTFKNIKKKA